MHQPTYREALKAAWVLVWHNTSLWLLGLLSVLFAGSFGLGNFLAHLMVNMGAYKGVWLVSWGIPTLPIIKPSIILGLSWLLGLAIVIGIAIIIISVVAKTSLLVAVADYYKNKTAPKLEKIWNAGLKYFWKILTIEVARKILLAAIAIIFGVVWYYLSPAGTILNYVVGSLALIAAILLGWFVSAVTIFTSGYVVIDGKPLLKSLKKAFQLFKNHMLVSFEISVILTILDLLLVIGFVLIFYFSFMPTIFIWLIAGALGNAALAVFGAILGFVLLIIFITIFGAIYNTFYTSVWMYLFMKMHHEGIVSRVLHHMARWFK